MNQDNKDEMLPEYDMRGAVRGKFLHMPCAGLVSRLRPGLFPRTP